MVDSKKKTEKKQGARAVGGTVRPPYPKGAPWPAMRGDMKNSGRRFASKEFDASKAAAEPVCLHTGNGIFSTPVLDAKERIYVGSGDFVFYVFDPLKNKESWRFPAKDIIDSAAVLSKDSIYVPAGEAIYALDNKGKEKWTFDVLNKRPEGIPSISTNYWWEANIVLGPDGAVYAPNDDFFLYCLEPDGSVRWTFRTGFMIWAAPAFDGDGRVFLSGFDMKIYALDTDNGGKLWETDLHNPLVGTPAVGGDYVYQGSFDGRMHALDRKTGRVVWTSNTGSHIYASAAIAENGTVFVTSTDGYLYAFDGTAGEELWKCYTGYAVRSSPVIGPDPENREDYLVYFGGGEGKVYAVDPAGEVRWTYDTLVLASRKDYPNINACPAAGNTGIAVATANGDIVWIPYDYYLKDKTKGIEREGSAGITKGGFYFLSPGGILGKKPAGSERAVKVHPNQIISLQLVAEDDGRTGPAEISPSSIRVKASLAFRFRTFLQSNMCTINVIPDETLEPSAEYEISVSAKYRTPGGRSENISSGVKIKVEPAGKKNAFLEGDHSKFEITHMAMPQPEIVPSLDQIGIACQTIPFAIIRIGEDGRFIAWAVQRFGESGTGEQYSIPDQRFLFYAFSGRAIGDCFVMEARNCHFEGSAFPVPLDAFRVSGRVKKDGTAATGASLLSEWEPPNIFDAWDSFVVSTEEEGTGQQNWVINAIVRNGPLGFLQAASTAAPTIFNFILRRIWKPWKYLNHEGRFGGIGTFRMKPLKGNDPVDVSALEVKKFVFKPVSGRVVAEVDTSGAERENRQLVLGILLIDDETGEPVPVNYNASIKRRRLSGSRKKVTLAIPLKYRLPGAKYTAILTADLDVVAELEI